MLPLLLVALYWAYFNTLGCSPNFAYIGFSEVRFTLGRECTSTSYNA